MAARRWRHLWGIVALWLCGAQAAWAQHTTWYFGEGATGRFEQDLLIANPTDTPARVRITFLTSTDPPNIIEFEVAPTSRKRVRVNLIPGLIDTEVSSIVESLNGVPIAAERTMYWGGAQKRGGHNAAGIETPRTEWFLAEAAGGPFFHTYVLLANPNAEPAIVTVRFTRDDGETVTRVVTIPAKRRHSIDVNSLPEVKAGAFGATITATRPILAERAMYWNAFEGGTSAPAVAAPSSIWLFAEGATLTHLRTFFLLSNPHPSPATVTLTFMLESGATIVKTVTVPATGRYTVPVQDYPDLDNVAFATTIASTLPIIAERAMYWQSFADGHASAGVTEAARKWAFAEGRVDVHEGVAFQTFFLFSNPSPTTPITVRGTFYREDGTGTAMDIPVPAHARVTFNAGVVSRLAGQDFAAFFEADAPFVAERSSYWDATWYGGHGSMGIPWSGPIATPPQPRAATPVFVTPGGTYHEDAYVELSAGTPGARIRYTRDGSEPTEASDVYDGPLFVTETTTIKAKAFAADYLPSETASAVYGFAVPPPIFVRPSGEYGSPIDFAISSATPNSHVRYSTDGSEPTESHPVYAGPIIVNDAALLTLKAKAYRHGWTPSATVTAVYDVSRGALQTPVATPEPGIYTDGQTVTLASPGQPFVAIRYTTDGSEPTVASTLYAGPFTLREPTTVTARAFHAGYTPSAPVAVRYRLRVATPTITPGSSPLPANSVSVHVSTTTPGATLRYTLDHSEPTERANQTPGGVTVGPGSLLQVRAYKEGWEPSELEFAAYTAQFPVSSPGVFTLPGIDEHVFHPVSTFVTFQLTGIGLRPGSVTLLRNSSRVSSSAFAVAQMTMGNALAAAITLPGLVDGRNDLEVYGADTNGHEVYAHRIIWAGSRSVVISVRQPDGSAYAGAVVRIFLEEDEGMVLEGITDRNGTVRFDHLPTREAFRVQVSGEVQRTSRSTLAPGATHLDLTLTPQDLAFEYGHLFWTGAAETFPHLEGTAPPAPCPQCPPRSGSSLGAGAKGGAGVMPGGDTDTDTMADAAADVAAADAAAAAATNNDVMVWTKQSMMSSGEFRFISSAGARRARVRYRFWSAERADGPLPDTAVIRLRSVTSGQVQTDSRNIAVMQTLGQLDVNGYSTWRTMSIPLLANGEEIELSVETRNAIDASRDTAIIVDYVEEDIYQVTAFELYDFKSEAHTHRDVTDEKLRYVSASPHNHWQNSGETRVNGTIRIEGPENARVQSVELELWHGQTRVAVAPIVSELNPILLREIGDAGFLEVSTSRLMFAFESLEFRGLFLNVPRKLFARVRVVFTNGQEAELQLGRKLDAFKRYDPWLQPRSGERDPDNCQLLDRPFPCGGDDWADPRTVNFITSLRGPFRWDDFSNMNGGIFPSHRSHQTGFDVDGDFPGYNVAAEATANVLLDALRAHGRKIEFIWATYRTGSRFHKAIADVQLPDGRRARDVIQSVEGHEDRFHVRLNPAFLP